MVELGRPYEILEWGDGQTQVFTVLSWELGELEIKPRDGREPKEIDILRIHLPPEEKPDFPHYWDLTSARLVAQLREILPVGGRGPVRVGVTAIGSAPRTHFSVTRLPEELPP